MNTWQTGCSNSVLCGHESLLVQVSTPQLVGTVPSTFYHHTVNAEIELSHTPRYSSQPSRVGGWVCATNIITVFALLRTLFTLWCSLRLDHRVREARLNKPRNPHYILDWLGGFKSGFCCPSSRSHLPPCTPRCWLGLPRFSPSNSQSPPGAVQQTLHVLELNAAWFCPAA